MSEPLPVVFVVPDLAVGGAERHLVSLVRAMDRRRFAPSVVCLGARGALFDELAAAAVPARALHHRKIDAPRTTLTLVRLLRRRRAAVVVTRGYSTEALGRLAALIVGVPAVTVVHNSSPIGRRTRARRLTDRLLTPRSAAVLALVEAQRPYLAALGWAPHQIKIVPPGVAPPTTTHPRATVRQGLGLAPEAEVITILARLAPEKDHATLLRAFARVVAARPHARLLVVGDGPERAHLTALAAWLEIDGAVTFTGARDDVGDLLAATDVATLSSRTECAPQALLEAMAAGVPVVATAVGGVPELVEHGRGGLLVPPADPDALALALEGLLADADRRHTLATAARHDVALRFDPDTWVRRTEHELAALARVGAPRGREQF